MKNDNDITTIADLESGRGFSFLEENEIHVFRIRFNYSSALFKKCYAALSEQEKNRAAFYEFESVKNNYIISQGGMRLILSRYLDLPVEKVNIGRHSKGKPFSLDDPHLYFNNTNSGDYVMYAFTRSGEIGIDLEHHRQLDDLEEMIVKNSSEKEQEWIKKNPELKEERFFKLWTVKEAYVKAIGEGMRLPPEAMEFSIEQKKFKLLSVKGVFEQEDWIISDLIVPENYIGTLVHLREGVVKNFEIV